MFSSSSLSSPTPSLYHTSAPPDSTPHTSDSTPLLSSISDIQHILFINLDHRHDRLLNVEREWNKWIPFGLSFRPTRFPAIKTTRGEVGCSLSHLKCLETALHLNWSHVLISEDDIEFRDVSLLSQQLNRFLLLHPHDWDVILLGGNNQKPYSPVDDTCVRVHRCFTTTCYLVRGSYLPTLIDNVRRGVSHLIRKDSMYSQFAIDVFWFDLQRRHRWFLIIPLSVTQRSCYSDISCRTINYDNLMLTLK